MPQVLIVEPDHDIALLLRDALALAHITGISVGGHGPQGAVMTAIAVHPDVILLELMPFGIAVARALRHHGFCQTPIIATTTSPACAHAARASGLFVEVIEKPFELDDLLLCVSHALPERSRAHSA